MTRKSGAAEMGQWPRVASLFLKHVGAPLRPVDEDLAVIRRLLNRPELQPGDRPMRGLILGVTPEYFHLPWPGGAEVRAMDRTPEMVDYVWPGPREAVVLDDWRNLAALPGHFDIVLCDGGLHLLDFPASQWSLASQLATKIRPGGCLVLRLFLPPVRQESSMEVLADLGQGMIPNVNYLKIRLGMALQDSAGTGVCLNDVWRALHAAEPDQRALANRLRWKIEDLQAIDAYKDSRARYHFVTLSQVLDTFEGQTRGAFRAESVVTPSYRLGERFPTLCFIRN